MPSTVQKYAVGTRCRSEVWDLYKGKIIHVPDSQDDFYKVRYTDGDEEELELDEVHTCRNHFLKYKKKGSEAKKKKYNMGTKVANYFPTGECVDGEIVEVNKNNYRVRYDDGTTETIDMSKMKEKVDAYKKAHPKYQIPTAKTPSNGKGKASSASNQKKAKAKAESKKSKQAVAKEAVASLKPMAQDEDDFKSSQKPKATASTRMSPRRVKASTSSQKTKASSTREKISSATQEIQHVSEPNIDGKDLFDDENLEQVDSNAKEQSISKAGEGTSKATVEDKAGEEEEQAETNTKDPSIFTNGPQHMDAVVDQASDLQVSNGSKKKGRRSVPEKKQSIFSRLISSVTGNGPKRPAESESFDGKKASVEKIDQQQKGKELSAGGDDNLEKAPQDSVTNSKSDQIHQIQRATSSKESETTSKESGKEPSNVTQTANANSRNGDADSGSMTQKSNSLSARIPKKNAKSASTGRKPPLATNNLVKSSKRKLPSSTSPRGNIGEPLKRKKGENSDKTISKNRPRPNSPSATVEDANTLQLESPGKKDALEALLGMKSGKYGNKDEKDVSENPVTEGSGNSKEVINKDSINEEEKLRLSREQVRIKALELKARKRGGEANPILIEDNDDDHEIEVVTSPYEKQLRCTNEGVEERKQHSSPPKLKNTVDSDEAIKNAQKAMKTGGALLSEDETTKSTKSHSPENGKSPLKKRKPSSNLSHELFLAENSRGDQSHTKAKSSAKKEAPTSRGDQSQSKGKSPTKKDTISTTTNGNQASLQAANSREDQSQTTRKSPTKKDAISTSSGRQASLQAVNPRGDQSQAKDKSSAKKDTISNTNGNQASLQATNARDKHSQTKDKSLAKKDAISTSSGRQSSLQAANSRGDQSQTKEKSHKHSQTKEKPSAKKDATSTSNGNQASLQATNARDKHSQTKNNSLAKKNSISTSPGRQVSRQTVNVRDDHSQTNDKSPAKKNSTSTSNGNQASLQAANSRGDQNHAKKKSSVEKKSLDSTSEKQVKKNKNTSDNSKEDLQNTNRLPFFRPPQGLPGKELVTFKKRRLSPEAFEQSSQRKKPRRKLPTAKNRDVSNSPEMGRKSDNPDETKVAATGEKAGQKKVVSSASSSSDDMSVSSEEERSEINVDKSDEKVICIAPIESKEKGIQNVNMSNKECNGLQKNVRALESEKGGETSMNSSCRKDDNLLVMKGKTKPSNIEKGTDGFDQQGLKAVQSVKAASKSIDEGIHARQQIALCSQVEKVSTAAIETEDNVSKSIPNDAVRKPAQEFLQTQLGTGTNSACPEKEDHSSTSKNENRKVKETRPNVSLLEGPSSPRVEDKDPLPSANILAERFGKTSSVDNTSSKTTPSSSSSEKSSDMLVDATKKANDTITLSKSTSTSSPPPTRTDPVAIEKVGKQPSHQESISKISSASANVSFQNKAAPFKQPKGRPPKGKRWDSVNGVWVPQFARTPIQPSKGADSPKKSGNVQNKGASTSKKGSKLPNKEPRLFPKPQGRPRLFPKPQGRPRLNCTWDSSNGIWIPNNDDQFMSNKQKSKITLRDSLEIKVSLNGEHVSSFPKMKYYGSWPDAKSNGSIRKASEDSSSGGFKRPRGRARLGQIWDSRLGKWVPDGRKKCNPPTATSPFKEKMDYLTNMDSESNKRGRTTRSEYSYKQELAKALHISRTIELKKLYNQNATLKTSKEDSGSGNLKRGDEISDSGNLKRGEENNGSDNVNRGEYKNDKGDNTNGSAITEEELDEIINTNGGTDHALNDLLNQAHSSPTKKTNMFGDTSFDGMGESISFANSNHGLGHGITTPTIDQILLNASPINNHRMSLPFSIEELNRDMERNHDLHHPSTRNPSSSGTNQQSSSNSTQQEIPPSGNQNMDVEGLTSPVIRLLGEVQTPSPYRNREAEARIAVANNLVHLRHSPILTSREQSPQNNTAAAQNDDGNTSNFDNTLFSGSNIQLPPRPSSAPPVLIPPRPSSAPPAIGTARVSFTTATSNHGRTIPTVAQNNNLLQRFSLGATQQQLATDENLPRIERGRQVAVAATNSASMRAASTVQQQQQVPVDRPRAEPAVRLQAAPINPPRPPVVEVQIPEDNAERHAQEREDELEEVSIEDDEEQQQPPAMQQPEIAQVAQAQDQNNEPDEAQAQQANNEGDASQESDAEPNGHLSYVAGRARFYTEDDSSIDNFVFESGWGSENDSDDSTEPGVVEPFEAARLRNLERQRQRRLREEREQQQQQQQQNQRNQQN